MIVAWYIIINITTVNKAFNFFLPIQIMKEMQEVTFCTFSHFLADVFNELASISCILQKNYLILPQAISAVRKTVMVLQGMKTAPQRGGMLCRFLDCQGQEEVSFQVC